jgi:hypothetical protein
MPFFNETFNGYPKGSVPKYFSDMEGAFEVAPCTRAPQPNAATNKAGQGKCLRQVITQQPITWAKVPSPITLVGDASWRDYQVSADVLVEKTGTASLAGRIENELDQRNKPHLNLWTGYYLRLADDGNWRIEAVAPTGTVTVLASGSLPGVRAGDWHKLALRFTGDHITGSVDGQVVAEVVDTTHAAGQVGFMMDSYVNAQVDNFAVTK